MATYIPRAYCWLCKQALRMYAHEKVATSIAWAYNGYLIYQKNAKAFQIGEVGFPWGGRFRPHKTHRNGLSVDIMVPLTTGALPTHIGNKYGYAEDFDGKGAGPSGQIDFAAIDAALLALDAAARQNDGRIARIFFAPDLQQYLSPQVRGKFQFNKNPSWVRHDDHYHIDFEFACSGT